MASSLPSNIDDRTRSRGIRRAAVIGALIVSGLPPVPQTVLSPASAAELVGPPDGDGHFAHCQGIIGREGFWSFSAGHWAELACQLGQPTPTGGSEAARVTVPVYSSPDFAGTPAYTKVISFPGNGYLGGLKYRKKIRTGMGVSGYPKLADATVAVRRATDNALLSAGWEAPATTYSDSTVFSPKMPTDNWPGGSAGGQQPSWDPWLRPPAQDEAESYGACIVGADELPKNIGNSGGPTTLHVRCNLAFPQDVIDVSVSVRLSLYNSPSGGQVTQGMTPDCRATWIPSTRRFSCDLVIRDNSREVSYLRADSRGTTFLAVGNLLGLAGWHGDIVKGTPGYPRHYWDGGTSGLVTAVPREQTFGSGVHCARTTGRQSDPVDSATGAFTTTATDVSLPGVGIPFTFTRSYTSADTVAGALGSGWVHSYESKLTVQPDGNVLLRGEDGSQVLYTRQPDGSFVAAAGGRSNLAAVAGGYELLRRDQVRYLFDGDGRLAALKDRNDRMVALAYADGMLTTITDTVGRTVTLSYDPTSRLLTGIAFPGSRTISYGYTGGRLTSVSGAALEGAWSYGYDAGGRLDRITDGNLTQVLRTIYGPDGRVTDQFDALNNRSTLSWDPVSETSTFTDSRGGQWRDVYSANILVRRIDPLGNSTSYQYDANHNLAAVTDARGNAWSMTYDVRGNLLTRIAPAPFWHMETFTNTARNDLDLATDARGNTTDYGYDASGNLMSITRPGNVVTGFGRDPAGTGLLASVTDPRGKTTSFEYESGNLIKLITPGSRATTMQYDASGRMTSLVDPRGNLQGANPDDYRWRFEYNEADQLTKRTDPLGNATEWRYDETGRLTDFIDAKSRTTQYDHNAAGELTKVTPPDAAIPPTEYLYDRSGNLCARKDPKGRHTAYAYDGAHRLERVTTLAALTDPQDCATAQTTAQSKVWTYGYDPVGNLTTVVTPAGTATPDPTDGRITYAYDELDQLKSIDYSDATPDVAYTYDEDGNRTSMTDGEGTETYAYDDLDRLTEVRRGTSAFSYEYWPDSSVKKRTYPDGTSVDYTPDDDGRLRRVASGGVSTVYSYDPAGRLSEKTFPTDYRETRTYDRAGRLTDVHNWQERRGGLFGTMQKSPFTLSRTTYTLDPVGNPSSATTPDGTTNYGYDALDRLTEACFDGIPCLEFIRYAYDEVGNRTREERSESSAVAQSQAEDPDVDPFPVKVTTYEYNGSDELISKTSGLNTTSYEFDRNGNQTRAGARTFSYDLANRLVSAGVAQTTTYAYDGDGNRVRASSGAGASQTTSYLWDPNAPLPELVRESDGSGALRRRYVYGLDRLSMTTGGSDYYFFYDGLGSVTNVLRGAAPEYEYSYEPFGEIRTSTDQGAEGPTNLMLFTGELVDENTEHYHLRARQYDPGLGRFLQTDPAPGAFPQGFMAPYLYVGNRPTVQTDPSGLRGEPARVRHNPCGALGDVAGAERDPLLGHLDLPDQRCHVGAQPHGLLGAGSGSLVLKI